MRFFRDLPSWLAAYDVYAAVILQFALVGAVTILRAGTPQECSLLGMLRGAQSGVGGDACPLIGGGPSPVGYQPLLLLLTANGFFDAARVVRSPVLVHQFRFVRRVSDR